MVWDGVDRYGGTTVPPAIDMLESAEVGFVNLRLRSTPVDTARARPTLLRPAPSLKVPPAPGAVRLAFDPTIAQAPISDPTTTVLEGLLNAARRALEAIEERHPPTAPEGRR